MHTKIKETTRKCKTSCSANSIEAHDGTIIMDKETLLERWNEYILSYLTIAEHQSILLQGGKRKTCLY